MSDENIIHVAPVVNPAQPNNIKSNRRGNPAGKIARLPFKIREQLNRRIRNNERSRDILPWLNGLPAVKKILAMQFDGKPINSQNFSSWRYSGYKQWSQRQEEFDEIQRLTEDAKDFTRAADGNLAHGTASVVAAKMLKTLHTIPAEQSSVNDLMKISYAVSALVNADQNQVRLKHEETRVFQGNERLVLSWDKFLRDRVETAQRALNNQIAKDIQAADIDNGEKIELLGHELFGKKWQGREVGKKEETGKKDTKKESAESAEVKKAEGQTADQQVRPTTVQGHSTEAAVSLAKEKAEELKASGGLPTTSEQHKETALAPLVRAATKAGAKEAAAEKTGMNITGSLTTAATSPVVAPNPKQKPPARELSPYDKALLEGKTHLEAMYAQFAPVKNAPPKPQEDPSVPKPSPWDAFSEPVKTSPLASFHGTMRPSVLG